MAQPKIVVVGAGVIGLTTALLLSRKDYSITVAAKHMPGDYDVEYASPWAGANYVPLMTAAGERANEWEKSTWPVLEDLASNCPEAGVHFQNLRLYVREKDIGGAKANKFENAHKDHPWLKHRAIPKSELPPHIASGSEFDSVCINTAIYLPWLVSQCLKSGVVFRRAIIKHVSEASTLHHSNDTADLIVNCTGLSARRLGGVEDGHLYPIRGQIVVVRNDAPAMYSISGNDAPDDEISYIMTRAAGGGTILGGCYQEDNWESQPDPSLAVRIMTRTVAMCPSLTNGEGIEKLSIIRHGVGLRPARRGGPRLEAERIEGVDVLHCYGHSGAGYQSSYGSCQEAAAIIDRTLEERSSNGRARWYNGLFYCHVGWNPKSQTASARYMVDPSKIPANSAIGLQGIATDALELAASKIYQAGSSVTDLAK